MNRHKTYWSVMGYEPSSEKRAMDEKANMKKKAIELMIQDSTLSWDESFQEIASMLVEIQKERLNVNMP